jgi:hypothetical protein
MAKVMNVVFGIGVAVILFIVALLGTQVFYKMPVYDKFCNVSYYSPVYVYDFNSCPGNITVAQCNMLIKNSTMLTAEKDKEMQECNQKYNDAEKIYGRNVFVIMNVLGIVAVIVSLFLFSIMNIAAGVGFAGLAMIFYGFMRGWQGTGDILKFIVALIVAAIFIVFAVMVNKRLSKARKK